MVSAAQSLLDQGHRLVQPARSADRAAARGELALRSERALVGDLQSGAETKGIADQMKAIGRMDAIIHNTGVYTQRSRGSAPEGRAGTLAINALAPSLLTALIERPLDWFSQQRIASRRGRLVGRPRLDEKVLGFGQDLRREQAAPRRACVRAGTMLAKRPKQRGRSSWARKKTGGARAPVDVEWVRRSQSWPAVSDDPAALVSGRYWHRLHSRSRPMRRPIRAFRMSSSINWTGRPRQNRPRRTDCLHLKKYEKVP
ncbi:hypothetical protein CI1B_26010 [Bradyrhizobium ivorense]|uniref:SDR family NAD(P)-dependent oxidoreductase n=1 Tax=Bradyrhizobium ivorense TaxID=2511166 RepID=A0A508T7U7_9BRAD|nr:hypothetical protein CI1B_26010 [Bradyrhizobium ivorense]